MRWLPMAIVILIVIPMTGCLDVEDMTVPEAVTPVGIVQDHRPTLTWAGDDRWSMYNVVLRSEVGVEIDEVVEDTSYRPATGLPNGVYVWEVRGWDGEAWTPFTGPVDIIVDAPTVTRTIEWSHLGELLSISVDVPSQAIQEHLSDDHSDGILERVDPLDPCIRQIAGSLEGIADSMGMDVYGRINLTLAMVQYGIDYRFDISSMGEVEYFRHPVETIADGVGDCEDKTLLFLSIAKNGWLGLDVLALLLPEGSPTHMAAAVRMDVDWCAPFMDSPNGGLLFCETVHMGMGLGEVPNEWEGRTADTIVV